MSKLVALIAPLIAVLPYYLYYPQLQKAICERQAFKPLNQLLQDTGLKARICSGEPSSPTARGLAELPLHDVSISLKPGATLFNRPAGLPAEFRELTATIPGGSPYYMSYLRMEAHTGTHIDAPAHFSKYHMEEGGITIEKISLDNLIGPAYVLEIPPGVVNITEDVLKSARIPPSCQRLLLWTDNSRNALLRKPFTPDYAALTSDGSRFLAQKTNIKSVGIDHLSIATSTDNVGGHVELFHKDRYIIPLEGLDLSGITPNKWYHLSCLPIKLEAAEGSPARCVLHGPLV